MGVPRTKGGGIARLRLALDTVGTFTDVVMADSASGALWTAKMPSTPAEPSCGFFDRVERNLESADVASSDVGTVFLGTTIATNAVFEGKGARTGMPVTAGCRCVLAYRPSGAASFELPTCATPVKVSS
jgi:N-methylhydantoinase A